MHDAHIRCKIVALPTFPKWSVPFSDDTAIHSGNGRRQERGRRAGHVCGGYEVAACVVDWMSTENRPQRGTASFCLNPFDSLSNDQTCLSFLPTHPRHNDTDSFIAHACSRAHCVEHRDFWTWSADATT